MTFYVNKLPAGRAANRAGHVLPEGGTAAPVQGPQQQHSAFQFTFGTRLVIHFGDFNCFPSIGRSFSLRSRMPLIMNADVGKLNGLVARACELCHNKDGVFRC